MKLLAKSSLIIVTVSIFIFLFGGVFFYIQVKRLIDQDLNEKLIGRLHQVTKNLHDSPEAINEWDKIEKYVDITIVDKPRSTYFFYRDTFLYDSLNFGYKPYRYLAGYLQARGAIYEIKIYESLISSNNLVERITLGFTIIALVFIFAIYMLNKIIFEQVWKDFFVSINTIEMFDVTKASRQQLGSSDIYEFNRLNKALNRMINRISQDYFTLKEYTENVSHEIQTPLAVIKSKTELLLQDENLSPRMVTLVKDIYNSASRLSRINQNLTLLARIDNNQYPEKGDINLERIVEQHLEIFSDIIEAKNITINNSSKGSPRIYANQALVDILVTNLLKNAVRYVPENGEIQIRQTEKSLEVINSGPPLSIPESKIFERFSGSGTAKNALGLGLAIVKKITDYYNFDIKYSYVNHKHIFEIGFKA